MRIVANSGNQYHILLIVADGQVNAPAQGGNVGVRGWGVEDGEDTAGRGVMRRPSHVLTVFALLV